MHATMFHKELSCDLQYNHIKLRKSHVRLMLLVTPFLMKPDFAYPQSKRHCVPVGINKPQGYLHQAGISCVPKEPWCREREREMALLQLATSPWTCMNGLVCFFSSLSEAALSSVLMTQSDTPEYNPQEHNCVNETVQKKKMCICVLL